MKGFSPSILEVFTKTVPWLLQKQHIYYAPLKLIAQSPDISLIAFHYCHAVLILLNFWLSWVVFWLKNWVVFSLLVFCPNAVFKKEKMFKMCWHSHTLLRKPCKKVTIVCESKWVSQGPPRQIATPCICLSFSAFWIWAYLILGMIIWLCIPNWKTLVYPFKHYMIVDLHALHIYLQKNIQVQYTSEPVTLATLVFFFFFSIIAPVVIFIVYVQIFQLLNYWLSRKCVMLYFTFWGSSPPY